MIDLHLGDCLDVLKGIEANSFDGVLCDPPYGLSGTPDAAEVLRHWLNGDDYTARGGGFMGKSWDSFVPGPATWREVYRVLKPGGHLLAFGGTRTFDLLTMALRLAGFQVRDVACYLYGAGFPKGHDISKAIDRAAGAERADAIKGGHMGISTYGGDGRNGDADDWHGEEWHGQINKGAWTRGTPATPLAATWAGYNVALKPAWEPCVVAMKPTDGTFAQNAQRWGVAGINVDGCRIGTGETITNHARSADAAKSKGIYGDSAAQGTHQTAGQALGRWPANLILDVSFVPTSVLRYNTPDGIKQAIQEYFHGYQLPGMRQRVHDLPQPNSEEQGAVLQQSVLFGGVVAQDDGGESLHVWQASLSGNDGENQSDATGLPGEVSGAEQFDVEGWQVSDAGLCNGSAGYIAVGGTSILRCDGNREREALRTGASACDGAALGQAAGSGGSCSSYQWGQDRQSNREPGLARGQDAQDIALGVDAGVTGVAGGERPLEIIARDVPECWLKYFEPSGWEVRDPLCAAALLDQQSGERPSGGGNKNPRIVSTFNQSPTHGRFDGPTVGGDTGGASRYFYCAKASRREREAGLNETEPRKVNDGRQTPIDNAYQRGETLRRNTHPTLKPLALCEYLARLILPPAAYRDTARLLVPFAGSGSEMIGALQAGWQNVEGIELEAEYVDIARRRLDWWQRQLRGNPRPLPDWIEADELEPVYNGAAQ